jgi:hypothetical protein
VERVPARSPHEAEDRYVNFISKSLQCVSDTFWLRSPALRGDDEERVIHLAGAAQGTPLRLRREDGSSVYFTALQNYRLVPDPRYEGEWKTTTLQYNYSIWDRRDRDDAIKRLLSWHWHPGSGKSDEPHFHSYDGVDVCGRARSGLHVPTGRVAFESVVLFLIDELDCQPLRDEWRKTINDALTVFVRFRTWPRTEPLETD